MRRGAVRQPEQDVSMKLLLLRDEALPEQAVTVDAFT